MNTGLVFGQAYRLFPLEIKFVHVVINSEVEKKGRTFLFVSLISYGKKKASALLDFFFCCVCSGNNYIHLRW